MDCWIPRAEGELLYTLVRRHQPVLTLEVGLANGLSTLFLTAAHAHNGRGSHIAIDPFQTSEWQNHGVSLVKFAGFNSHLRVIEDYAHRALPRLEAEQVSPSLVFIDGAHLFDYVISDFFCVHRLLPVGGLIAFDDSDWPSIRKALRYILLNHAYRRADTPCIERSPGRPSPLTHVLGALGRHVPRLTHLLAPTVVRSDDNLGIAGRCVVLQKTADDRDRDTQQIADFADF
jgi:predicted O-methyltransferase YrrM